MFKAKKIETKCKNCKHSYSLFKQVTDENGLPIFITEPRCRLDKEILPDGLPVCTDCFEPR